MLMNMTVKAHVMTREQQIGLWNDPLQCFSLSLLLPFCLLSIYSLTV